MQAVMFVRGTEAGNADGGWWMVGGGGQTKSKENNLNSEFLNEISDRML